MSKTITIDLNDNPDIKDLVADKEMGDKIDLHTAIKSMDDQTLVLTIESAEEGSEEESDDEESEDEEAESDSKNTGGPRTSFGGTSY